MKGLIITLCVTSGVLAFPANNAPDTDGEYALLEGDMVEVDDDDEFGPLNAITNLNRCWTNNRLPYSVSSAFTAEEAQMIDDGVQHLMEVTNHCVEFFRRTTETAYVSVAKSSSGCSAVVGMSGGAQNLQLTNTCVRRNGTVMHEFLHSLGFRHEQSRWDRDEYVYVNFDNIRPGAESNFRKHSTDEIQSLNTMYDYGSVMHYSGFGFAVDPSIPTIIPLDEEAEIGQRVDMSLIDRERVQIFYGCLKPEDSIYHQSLAKVELLVCGEN